jgi:hypothetical protein
VRIASTGTVFFAALVLGACGASPANSTRTSGANSTVASQDIWYLSAPGLRATVKLSRDSAELAPGLFVVEGDSSVSDAVDSVQRDSSSLSFRRIGNGFWEWYRGTVVMGVVTGRMARTSTPAAPDDASFSSHFSGWSSALDTGIVPRVFDLTVGSNDLVRVRIDGDGASGFVGRFKRYATVADGAAGEALEYDLQVDAWDGTSLRFKVGEGELSGSYFATVQGRLISGAAQLAGGVTNFSGARAEVLTHGLSDLSPAARAAWQDVARKALVHLLMADNPTPTSATIQTLQQGVSPLSSSYSYNRDDDPDHWAQAYTLGELQLDFTLADPHGGPDIHRVVHGWMSTPLAAPPAAGYPVAVAINGHLGSAYQMFDPGGDYYYYGDAYARRGYVVISLDMSHRPLADRQGLYGDFEQGDDPEHGNIAHPSIKSNGFDSDFEEDGERTWDVIHSVEALLAKNPNLDASRLLITGLSMGGEVTTWVGALDERFPLVVPAGFSPDLSVMSLHGNHECWMWQHADIREYLDVSDLHALIAPRTLVVETGRSDWTYSDFAEPFAGDKQVARRSRSAFADAPANFVHYLHYDEHHYHFGDVNPSWPSEEGLRVPTDLQPVPSDATGWEIDSVTATLPSNLFGFTSAILSIRSP